MLASGQWSHKWHHLWIYGSSWLGSSWSWRRNCCFVFLHLLDSQISSSFLGEIQSNLFAIFDLRRYISGVQTLEKLLTELLQKLGVLHFAFEVEFVGLFTQLTFQFAADDARPLHWQGCYWGPSPP